MLRFGVPLGAALIAFVPVATVPGSYELYGETRVQLRLPGDLCTLEQPFEQEFLDKLDARADRDELLAYMLENCPEIGIALADVATASISTTDRDERRRDQDDDDPLVPPATRPDPDDGPDGGPNDGTGRRSK